jgi:hypothetical protein
LALVLGGASTLAMLYATWRRSVTNPA